MTSTADRVLMTSDLSFDQRMCPHVPPREEPVRRIRTPAGDEAWLVSGYAEVRELLGDSRLGRSHPAPDERACYAGEPTYDQVTAADHQTADMLHSVLRSTLKPYFSARRMLALRPALRQIVDDQLDRLEAAGQPADLRTGFSTPVILRALCELLGVPEPDRSRCVTLMAKAGEGDLAGLAGYLAELVGRLRENPDDSMLSSLCAAGATDEQVVQLAMVLQFAGVGATRNQIDYGVLLLNAHPEQRAALAADPEAMPRAVEEILRVSGSASLPRYARADIEIGGVTIAENDLVLLDLTLANVDSAGFDDPGRFDPARSPNRHVTFSHGVWTCLGAPLARLILRTVFEVLLARLPGLRPAGELVPRSVPLSGGLPERFDVTW
ncbi:cytochrome P450 [Amycolatopsis suaedae]|uniref:Cytochrome P450 n=1 Tax=Amycolatopsis suaedae TaxID=2510978 RepID=A0A4Q7J8E6_9PSEU|nr:cytochrome P450 [Amycolatopsis suaedae]RZQ63971.1 cytochrome P450 [Amycolatopsis suaedae]